MYNPAGGQMRHAKVKPAKAEVHATHPYNHRDNHQALLEYLQARLLIGKQHRDNAIPRMIEADKAVSGWMALDEEDRKRKLEKIRSGKASPVSMNLPLTFVHLDDMVTYFSQTFCPSRGMFYHSGKPDEAKDAQQIVTLMNNHSIYAGWYRQVLLTLHALCRYNMGGFICNWGKDHGPKLEKNDSGQDVLTSEVKWQGNRLEAIDMYNFLYDPSVHVAALHTDGEFAAIARIRSHFWLRKAASEGKYFNVEEALANDNGIPATVYYRSPPKEAMLDSSTVDGTDRQYAQWFTEAPAYASVSGFEITEIYIRLNPTEFGLVEGNAQQRQLRNRYELWRFSILNDKYIIEATYMNNIHGFIPCFVGLINDDLMAHSQKSVGEILTPLQDFASFLVNTHMKAVRKNIWGLTVYDPSIVDLKAIPEGEVAAYVPVKSTGFGKDIRQFIWSPNNVLETKQTLSDLEGVMGLINQFFPTQSLPSQIASIDRAVDSQVAAVQQGSNRRLHKTARLLDDSLFRWIRFCCYYNIIQYQPDNSTVNDFYGREVSIDLSTLRGTDLPFIIGQGLKAIDRQAAASSFERVLFALIQNPQAAAGVRLLDMIGHWVSMIDIDVDMTQFAAPVQMDPATGQPVSNPTSQTAASPNPGEGEIPQP